MTDRTPKNAPEPTQANGFALGRPESRESHELDAVVTRIIDGLPAAARLYPDVWAWKVTDAILQAQGKGASETEA